MTPYLPVTPEQISDDALACEREGAAIVHIHARDPKTATPTSDPKVFRAIAERIKSKCKLIVNTTTGGSIGMSVEERIAVVKGLRPELASLNLGSMNFYIPSISSSWKDHFVNTFDTIESFSKVMKECGTKPECEIYDLGMLSNLKYLIDRGMIESPPHLQLVLGVIGGAEANVETASFLRLTASRYFPACTWSICATGRFEFPMITWGILERGNIRVGIEDNIYTSKGVLAKGSSELVAKAVRIIRELGQEPATADEARQILGLKGPDKVDF